MTSAPLLALLLRCVMITCESAVCTHEQCKIDIAVSARIHAHQILLNLAEMQP